MAKKKSTNARKRYTAAEKAEIVTRLERESVAAVSAATGVSRISLATWKKAAGVAGPDGRFKGRASKPRAAANGAANGHASKGDPVFEPPFPPNWLPEQTDPPRKREIQTIITNTPSSVPPPVGMVFELLETSLRSMVRKEIDAYMAERFGATRTTRGNG